MIGQQELFDMIATEVAETITLRAPFSNEFLRPYQETEQRRINYDLRLVTYPDGRKEWKD